MLQKGIDAIKISFNKPNYKQDVVISLHGDGKSLKYVQKSTTSDFLKKYFSLPRTYNLTKMIGFSYGPKTFTFEKLQKQVVYKSRRLRMTEMQSLRMRE